MSAEDITDPELDALLDLALPAALPPGAGERLARPRPWPVRPERFPWVALSVFLFGLGVAAASDLRHADPRPPAPREAWGERVAPTLPAAEQPVPVVADSRPPLPRFHVALEATR